MTLWFLCCIIEHCFSVRLRHLRTISPSSITLSSTLRNSSVYLASRVWPCLFTKSMNLMVMMMPFFCLFLGLVFQFALGDLRRTHANEMNARPSRAQIQNTPRQPRTTKGRPRAPQLPLLDRVCSKPSRSFLAYHERERATARARTESDRTRRLDFKTSFRFTGSTLPLAVVELA